MSSNESDQTKRPGDQGGDLSRPDVDSTTAGGGLSLKGVPGLEVARNLLKLSAGIATPAELGDNYYRAEDGSLGIIVDEETIEAIRGQHSV